MTPHRLEEIRKAAEAARVLRDDVPTMSHNNWRTVHELLAHIDAQSARIEELSKALEFYTDPGRCQLDMEYEFVGENREQVEFGTTAKRALARLRERVSRLEQLLKDIAPSWLPEGIRDRRREILDELFEQAEGG